MTTVHPGSAATTTGGGRVLAPRTVRAYAGDWALFTDWCHTTGSRELPADPATLVAFLTDCPAAPATLRRRVAAIDHRHTANGQPPPGRSTPVLAALGRPAGEHHRASPGTVTAVQAALRGLPSHGWTRGVFGRRDRSLLVLSRLAGVPYRHLAALTAGDITVIDGTATVNGAAGGWTLTPDDDPVLCGPCAIVRWLEVLDVAVTRIATVEVAGLLKTAPEVTGRAPHTCPNPVMMNAATQVTPLLSPIDQWGALPFPGQRLTPHSLSRRVRDLLAGNLGAHRTLTVNPDDAAEPDNPIPTPAPPRPVHGQRDRQRAWDRRRADLRHLAGVNEELTDVDRRVDELNRRAMALLETETGSQRGGPTPTEPRLAESH